MKLRKQERDIVEYLVKRNSWVSSDELSSFLNISIRTLRSRIKDINISDYIIMSSKKGYHINNTNEAIKFINQGDISQDETVTHRRNQIIKELLLSNSDVSVYDLSEKLCVSDATILNDIRGIKQYLSRYNIILNNTNGNLSINSSDTSYRKLMSDIVYQETSEGFLNYHTLEEIFPGHNVNDYKNIIQHTFNSCGIVVNDYGLISIILHLCIILERSDRIKTHSTSNINKAYLRPSRIISEKLHEEYGTNLTENDVNSIATLICLYARTKAGHVSDFENNKLNLFEQQIKSFVKEMTDVFYQKYFVDIRDDIFISGMTFHLEQLIYNFDRKIKNPLYISIRNGSPVIYELAVIASDMIKEKWPFLNMDENEISYIAIHIGLAFEKQERIKLKVALVNLDYSDSSAYIANKIMTRFSDAIRDIDCFSDENELNEDAYDLIISTFKLSKVYKNNIAVSLFLNEHDILNIQQTIDNILFQKTRLDDTFIKLFHRDLFICYNEKAVDENSIIEVLSQFLVKAKVEDATFTKRVLEREQASSTSYLNIAIPHTFNLSSKKTSIAVAIFHNPINWGSSDINIALLLSVSKNDQKSFVKMMEKIIKLFTSSSWNKTYKKIKTYDQFLEFIKTYGKETK